MGSKALPAKGFPPQPILLLNAAEVQPPVWPRHLTCIGVVPLRACGLWRRNSSWNATLQKFSYASVCALAVVFKLPTLRQACGPSLGQKRPQKNR